MSELDTQVTRDPTTPKSPTPKSVRRKRTWRSAPAVEMYYDSLLRRLQASGCRLDSGPCAIGVTSAEPGEGVTTVAVNLVLAANKISDDPILFVDANVTRPSKTRLFRARRGKGLENVLAGEADVFDCIVNSPVEHVSHLPPGRLRSGKRPAYDLASIEEMLDQIKHMFPLIFFDLPPSGQLTSCLALAGCLDGVVMVVEAGRAATDTVQRAKRELQRSNANLLGVVLNKQRG